MKPSQHYRGKEQTYVKHFFLEQYLETVAFHIGSTHSAFVYVDCFSGPWQSGDEYLADTSIRIALDKLNYVHNGLIANQRYVNVEGIFIEKDPSAFKSLKTVLDQHAGSIKSAAFPGTFEENIPAILKQVGRTFAFFFIDPRGWTGFAMDNITPILRHHPGEVMVNFMYDFINRFINYPEPGNEQSLDKFFGTQDWRKIRESKDREQASIDLYQEQLRMTGNYAYVTSMRILKPLHDRAYFHLIYATRNPKGVIEFRSVEKKTVMEQERVRATAQRTHRETKSRQTELAFEPPEGLSISIRSEQRNRLKQAEKRLFELLDKGPVRYEELQPRILELPLVWKSDLDSMLMSLHKEQRILIKTLAPRQRIPKVGNLIQLVTANS